MKKQNLRALLILTGIGIFLIIIFYKPTNNDLMSVRYYDENRNLINPTLSTVDDVPNVEFIDITVKVLNNGQKVLSCDIIDIKPLAFNNAITKTNKQIGIGLYGSWTSILMDTVQFESMSQPVHFNATVKCSYNDGQQQVFVTPDQIGDITFQINA